MKKRVVLLFMVLAAACIVGVCSVSVETEASYNEKQNSLEKEEAAEDSILEQTSEAMGMVEDFYEYLSNNVFDEVRSKINFI